MPLFIINDLLSESEGWKDVSVTAPLGSDRVIFEAGVINPEGSGTISFDNVSVQSGSCR